MFQHVVVAVDFSATWEYLLKALPKLRGWGSQRLSLIYVLAEDYPQEDLVRYRRHYQRRLDALAAELSADDLQVEGYALIGDPVTQVIAKAVEVDADCIVAGNHGHTTFREVFLGSTVLNLARLTSVPLLVVPVADKAPLVDKLHLILLATDGSEAAKAPEQVFMGLVHKGIKGIALFATERGDVDARTREVIRAEAHLKQLVRLSSKLQILDTRIVKGSAPTVITETARQAGAELIVIGKRGLNRLQTLLLGSTVEAVCRQTPCPVLVVPATVV